MNISIPQTYEALTPAQRKELCHILLTATTSEDTPLHIIKLLLSHLPARTQRKVLREVPFSALWQYAEPFLTTEKLYHFPTLSLTSYLLPPADRLANLTIKQFSVADSIYYRLRLSQFQNETLLRQLVAALYNFSEKPFDVLNLPKVAEHTDKEELQTAYEVAFAYTCCREYIISKFPKVFSGSRAEGKDDVPKFSKAPAYTPFSKVINVMAMDQHQPLGNWHQCNATRVYDFFEVLTESILQAEKLTR